MPFRSRAGTEGGTEEAEGGTEGTEREGRTEVDRALVSLPEGSTKPSKAEKPYGWIAC